jgi:hypothetical protein
VPDGLTDAQVIARLERLERNVRALAEHIGVALEDPAVGIDTDIIELARSGDRTGAAKQYVERTGADFVEAQRIVSEL